VLACHTHVKLDAAFNSLLLTRAGKVINKRDSQFWFYYLPKV
jgi:hypothetical protein